MYDRFLLTISMRSVHWIMFVVIGVILYGFTLNYPFVFDDHIFIADNPLINKHDVFLDLRDISEFISNNQQLVQYNDLLSSFARRPMAYLSFHLNYLLGGNNPAGFRAFNIAVHICNTIILYSLLRSIIMRRGDCPVSVSNITIPLFAALIFLVHPLHTQAVTYVTQRFTSFGTFFYLATMLLYHRSNTDGATKTRRLAYVISIIALIFGLLTKESVLTLPIALVMMDVILLRYPWRRTLIHLAPHIACMSLTPILVLNVSDELNGNAALLPSALNIVGGVYTQHEYAITQVRTILSYIRLLVLPYNQSFDPSYPLYRSMFHPEIVISLLIWAIFIVTGFRLLKLRDRNICTDLMGFSIFWFILSVSVSSSFIPQSQLMYEHRSYLPSLAFCVGSVAYLHNLIPISRPFRINVLIIGLCLATAVFGILTTQRNHIYRSRISLWSDTVMKSPDNYRAYYGLGSAYLDNQMIDQAISCFWKSQSLNPVFVDTYLSLGQIYLELGMPQTSINVYKQYLSLASSKSPKRRILKNLAWAYVNSGKLREALDTTTFFIKIYGDDLPLISFHAELNLRSGNISEAQRFIAKARKMDRIDNTIDLSSKLLILEKLVQKQLIGEVLHNS